MFGRQSRKERKRSELIYLLADDLSHESQTEPEKFSHVNMEGVRHLTDAYSRNKAFPRRHRPLDVSPHKFGVRHMQDTMNIMEVLSPERYFD